MTVSEELFEELCRANGVPCEPVPTREFRTPDFRVILKGVSVVFEIKQIDPNKEDEAELERLSEGKASGRYLPNRLRNKLDNISSQLKTASDEGSGSVLSLVEK